MIFMNQLNKTIKKTANIKNGTIISKVMHDDETDNLKLGDLPYRYYQSSSVVYHGEIHIMGGLNAPKTQHYKWDGESWSEVSTLPFELQRGCAVVYNDEIHIFDGVASRGHYKWDGISWTNVDNIPITISNCSAVIYNNEIHFIAPGASVMHYKYDGTTWTRLEDLPFTGSVTIQSVAYNNKIYVCGVSSNNKVCYSYDDDSGWTDLTNPPDGFIVYATLVYNNKMHFLAMLNSIGYHYTFDGETWEEIGELPYVPIYSSALVYNNKIHLLGGGSGAAIRVSHYILGDKGIYPHIHISNLGAVNVYASGRFSQSGDDIYVLASESVPDIFVYDENEENLLYTNKILTYNQTTGKYEIYGYFPTTLKNINATITSSRWRTLRLDTPNLFN